VFICLLVQDTVLKRDLRSILVSLENLKLLKIYTGGQGHGSQSALTDETAVFLGVPPIEAGLLFENQRLRLSDKVRRAVLEPMNPLVGDNFSGEQSIDMLE
jgi:hypothetical protein